MLSRSRLVARKCGKKLLNTDTEFDEERDMGKNIDEGYSDADLRAESQLETYEGEKVSSCLDYEGRSTSITWQMGVWTKREAAPVQLYTSARSSSSLPKIDIKPWGVCVYV